MNESCDSIFGDYIEPASVEFEASLTFSIKAVILEKEKLWKSKDLTAEFLGDFWKNILDIEVMKSTIHFVCAELLENAVYHSKNSEYFVLIELCFKTDEMLIYVKNSADTDIIPNFKIFIKTLLETDNLQKLFIRRMKEAKKTGSNKSQVGLITIMKDRGAKLSWKFKEQQNITNVTTMARIPLKGKENQ